MIRKVTGCREIGGVDRSSMHAGVVSNSGVLLACVLSSQERFDNPVMEIRVTRVG